MTLELRSVEKRLDAFTLPALDLTVEEGEYLVLVGPSGVGKTVLLEIIAGLLSPDAGRIYWRGRDVTTRAPEHRGFGIVYQDYALFPHMTVYQNIVYGLNSRRMTKTEARERATVTAEQLGIFPLLDRLPDTLSGGEQQRVALSRALVVTPELLLLDEPLSAVDMRLRRLLRPGRIIPFRSLLRLTRRSRRICQMHWRNFRLSERLQDSPDAYLSNGPFPD